MLAAVKKIVRVPFRVKILIIIVIVLSIYSNLLFRFFSKQARFGTLSNKVIGQAFVSEPLLIEIAYAIRVVSKYTFWTNLCRHQAYQARIICRHLHIPYAVYVGFTKHEAGTMVKGHAWTMVNGRMITGF